MGKLTKSNFSAFTETLLGYRQMFIILGRRRFWLLGGLCSALSITTVLTLITKPTYGSFMTLLAEPVYQEKKNTKSAIQDIDSKPKSQYVDYNFEMDYATQLNLMRSPLLFQQAVDLLRPTYSSISVEEIKKSLVLLERVKEEKVYTKLIVLVYTDHNPVKAQKVLEALETVYQVYSIKQQEQPLINGLGFINRQLPNVQDEVNLSEAELGRFRRGQNLINPEQQAATIAKALNAIKQERQATQIQYKDYQAREIDLQQKIGHAPQDALISSRLSQSSRYQKLLNEFQKTELSLARLHGVFTDDDPRVRDLVEQQQKQQDLLQNEVKRVLGDETAQLKSTGEGLLAQGQFGGIDQNFTAQLAEVQTNLRVLLARDRSLEQREQKLREDLNRFPSLLSEYDQIAPKVQINHDQLEQMLKARQDLKLEIVRPRFILHPLVEPLLGVKIGPSLKRNLLLGTVAGLLLGSIAAFIREMVDDTVLNPDELEKQVGLSLLGTTPKLPQSQASEPLVKLPFGKPQVLAPWTVQVINWPPAWESLDLVFKNIQLHSVSPFKSLMFTSALAGEGKSTLTFGLALSAARLHQRVLLIDADLRCPSLHKQLNLPNEQGLSTLLTSDATVPKPSRIESSGSYIDILTAGPTSTDPAKLLNSQRMRQLMAAFEESYDLVMLDVPPVLGVVDSILAASFCSSVVLVARIGKVTRTELIQAKAMLSQLNLIGVVANAGG